MSLRADPEDEPGDGAIMEEKEFVLDERSQFEEAPKEEEELEKTEMMKEENLEVRREQPNFEEPSKEDSEKEDMLMRQMAREQTELLKLESENPSVAQAAPESIAFAGIGGVASAQPMATAASLAKDGLAFAAPSATSVAGDFLEIPEVKEADTAEEKDE